MRPFRPLCVSVATVNRLVPNLQLGLVILLFVLIVLGAGVRIAGAGLACPDWPLCFGDAIPRFDFQIFMEWIHRVLAMVVGLLALLITFLCFIRDNLRKRYGFLLCVSLLIFAFQAYLGRQTVIELLRAEIVTAHLLGGYALFALNFFIALHMKNCDGIPVSPSWKSGFQMGAIVLAVMAYFQAALGGLVSSHYAGMVCPDFPTCQGSWWPGFSGLIGLQFAHRLGAFVLMFGILFFAIFPLFTNHARNLARPYVISLALVVLQIFLGISMIHSAVHPVLSLLHSANSLSIFTLLLWGVFRVFERSRLGSL